MTGKIKYLKNTGTQSQLHSDLNLPISKVAKILIVSGTNIHSKEVASFVDNINGHRIFTMTVSALGRFHSYNSN